MYLWFKLLHVFFVIFVVRRTVLPAADFVNLAQVEAAEQPVEYERLSTMSRRLYKFMSPLGFGTLVCGMVIPFVTGWWGQGWLINFIAARCFAALRKNAIRIRTSGTGCLTKCLY